MDFVAKILYIIALPLLKLFKSGISTYDVQDITADDVPFEAFVKIVLAFFGTIALVSLLLWGVYNAPQQWYNFKRDIITSDESSPLIKDAGLKQNDAVLLTPKAKDVNYVERPEIKDDQARIDALKEKAKEEQP